MDEDFRERFWSRVCELDRMLVTVLVLDVAFLVLLSVSALTVEDPASAVVLQIDFAIVLFTIVAVSLVLANCRRRQ